VVPSLYDFAGMGNYDVAGELLSFLLTNIETNAISSLNDSTEDWQSAGVLRRFKQKEFVEDVPFGQSGLAQYGHIYYPNSCISQSCKVHMHLHGCSDI
jgi:hypothetical protein